MEAALRGLEASGFALFFRQSIWLYPIVEVLHIIGFVILVGAAFILDVRLLGGWRSLPLLDAVDHLTRWAHWSLFLVVPSGFILFAVDATSLAANPAFRIKLLLILAAGVNAGLFHALTYRSFPPRSEVERGGSPPLTLPARLAGGCSILLWFSVIASGRLIAYL